MQPLKEKGVKITPTVKKEIIKIIDERIREAHVTKEDFSELKGIVKELAEAQKRTEQRLEGLAARVEELAEAQKRTEQRLEGLTVRVEELAGKVAVLAEGLEITRQELKLTRGELGGLSRTMGYAFENEAFRMLPDILKRNRPN
jgi:chromosome segregation ATPase